MSVRFQSRATKKIILGVFAVSVLYCGVLFSFRDPGETLHLDLPELRKDSLHFGGDFLWGSATSAYQVEGNSPANNWTAFEETSDETGTPRIERRQRCGAAADEWNRYPEDIALMRSLHLNAYRFSVEWSRIEPAEGVFSDSALGHYSRMVDELRANGIEPMVTLHHFTNPQWFETRGGFLRDDSPEVFARFVSRVVQKLGTRVGYWVTINEPSVYVLNGYIAGVWPPGLKDPAKGATVFRNLLRAHSLAYQEIKKQSQKSLVGIALNIFLFDPPSRWFLPDVLVARTLNRAFYAAVLDYLNSGVFDFSIPGFASVRFDSGVPGAYDFVGLNYYSRLKYRWNPFTPEKFVRIEDTPPPALTDMGWEIYPDGLYRSLAMITSKINKPVYITENGLADDSDLKRSAFIEDHLMVLNRAIRDGIDVRGYFYWSLLDNFEWAYGYDKRFGLYSVDFATQRRTLRAGSKAYPEFVQRAAARARQETP